MKTHEDLPRDWPRIPLTDPDLAPAIINLCISGEDRLVGGLSVLFCRARTFCLDQPIFVSEVPRGELPDAAERLLLAGSHLPGVGGAVISIVRPRGTVDDWDREIHQRAIAAGTRLNVPVIGMYVVTRTQVMPLPDAEVRTTPLDAA